MNVTLGEIASFQKGFAFKSQDYVRSGHRIIRVSNLNKKDYRDSSCLFIDESKSYAYKKYSLYENDAVISTVGSWPTNPDSVVGKVTIIPKAIEKSFLNQNAVILRACNGCTQDFLNYSLLDKRFSSYITGTAQGSASQASIKLEDIKKYEVFLPSKEQQKRATSILRSLDDKIELNNRINENLEQQAQALYRELFVDKPDAISEVCRAEEYFDISIGKTPPRKEPQWFAHDLDEVTWVSIADMGASGLYISESSEQLTKEAVSRFNVKVVPTNTVLLSFKLTVGRVAITDSEMTTNEAIAHFVTQKPEIIEYLYCYLKDFNYQTMGSTSSIATAVNSKIIKAMPFQIPEHSLLEKYHSVVSPMFAKIKANQTENKRLATILDSLLPKLMSGELDVSEIDL